MRVVAVLTGGPSSEHHVSRWSGERVLESLDRRRYNPIPVVIERDGMWTVRGVRKPGPLEAVAALRDEGCEAVFIALHGSFGEDGTVQGFLETVGLPYTGSGVAGAALAMDKIRSKRLVATLGVPVARDLIVPPAREADVQDALGYPVFVKDPLGGSSLEVVAAHDAAEFEAAVARLAPGCDALLVEEAIEGREVTVPVLDDEQGRPEALPVVEIRSDGDFFDFRNKYTSGVAQEIVPARIPRTVAERLQETTLRIHRRLGLRALSRNDFILRPDGAAVYLESNPIPGLTPNSILPKAAAVVGLDFRDLLTRLIEGAIRWRGVHNERHGASRAQDLGRRALDRQPRVLREEAPLEEGPAVFDAPPSHQG